MWIASTLGFFSAAYKHGAYNVRARTEQDVQNLIGAAGLETEVLYLPEADYQYRVLLDHMGFEQVMAVLARTVTYPNFKDQIRHTEDQRDKEPYYVSVWAQMAQWGDEADGYSMQGDGERQPIDPSSEG